MQAILITAYKDPEQLYMLADMLREKYSVFIHIDAKNVRTFDMKRLEMMHNVSVYSRYEITWGSINHLYALIYLMKKALEHRDVSYIHLISAQDMPVSSLDRFENDDHIYMTLSDVPEERWRQYNFFQKFDQGSVITEHLYRGSVKLQKFLHISRKRLGSFKDVYKGMIWCSMPRAAAEYAVQYVRVYPKYLKELYSCYLPEELFFQTLFMNSKEWKDRIIKDNLRYTDWHKRNGSIPAVLDESDYKKIITSDACFARKIDSAVSAGLIRSIRRQGL